MIRGSTETIWKQFGDRIRGFIARRVREPADVDDLVQEVFARIHTGVGRLKDGDRLEAWLFQVARRAVLDHFRRQARRGSELPAELSGPQSPDGTDAEVASWLEPMMTLLAAEDREALKLTEREGLTQGQLARRLGLSLSGAKSRVQRARQRLKGVLLECCHIEWDRRGNAVGYTRRSKTCGLGPCSCG
jgi:RNA polymerase sigma-70 factor (ECF subfamily)